MPESARSRLIDELTMMPTNRRLVTVAAIFRVAFAPTPPICQAPAEQAASTRVRLRPAQIEAKMPVTTRAQLPLPPVEFIDDSICLATEPVTLAEWIRFPRRSEPAIRLASPTTNTMTGMKKRKRRIAIALPSTDANVSRSRS